MKLVKEHINEKFEKDSDPIHDMGIGNIYHIDFFYADHPSIEDSYVAEFIHELKMTIKHIDPETDFEIKMTDFADGVINFKGGSTSGEKMLKKLKKTREKVLGSWGSAMGSWDFGDFEKGIFKKGVLYDSKNYEKDYCDNCGEELTDDNELTGDGHCQMCDPKEDDD